MDGRHGGNTKHLSAHTTRRNNTTDMDGQQTARILLTRPTCQLQTVTSDSTLRQLEVRVTWPSTALSVRVPHSSNTARRRHNRAAATVAVDR